MKFEKNDIGKRFLIKIKEFLSWQEVSVLEFTSDEEQVRLKINCNYIYTSGWYDNNDDSFYIIKSI